MIKIKLFRKIENSYEEEIDKTYEEFHRELWNWLADNPNKDSLDWFLEFHPNWDVRGLCFACESCDSICLNCPLPKSNDSQLSIKCGNGIYTKWIIESNFEKRSK